ncbi:hypothetical protein SBV1_2940008 [Verrucomicrobia bacterium]|nr:hypothetical protein SBV1_2940008 [Verrucomicrobiota bacterium]
MLAAPTLKSPPTATPPRANGPSHTNAVAGATALPSRGAPAPLIPHPASITSPRAHSRCKSDRSDRSDRSESPSPIIHPR